MAFHRRFWAALTASLLAFTLGWPASAEVIDMTTGKPIAGSGQLALWLDSSAPNTLWQDVGATMAAADGVNVALWQDISGNAKHVSNSDNAYRPAYAASVSSLGDVPAVYFVGGNNIGDVLFRTNDLGITGNADRTVVTVWVSTAFTGQNYQHTFHMGTQAANQAYGHSVSRTDGGGTPIGNHYWSGGFDSTATAVLNQPRLAVSSWDGDGGTGANGRDWWWIDGAAAGSSDRAALATGTNELKIGSRLNNGNSGNEGFTGYLAEVIVFSTVLTTAERQALNYYIQDKYGFFVQNASLDPTLVFNDDFAGVADGTPIHGKAPLLGGANWSQTFGPAVTVEGGQIDTTGAAREIVGTFTEALGPNGLLTLTFDASKLTQNGFAGISLHEGVVEKLFVGDVNDGTFWTMAKSSMGGTEDADKFTSLVPSGAGEAVFTYDFNSGLSTLSIDGSDPISGFLPAGAAVNSFRIWNNNGGDVALRSISVNLAPVPEPGAWTMLTLAGLLGLGAFRRRRKSGAGSR